MKERTLHIPEVGNIILVKSPRARKLNIRIKPFQDIRVAIPTRMTYGQAEKFVYQRLDWIRKHQPKIQALENKLTVFDEDTHFHTRSHRLRIVRDGARKLAVRAVNGQILVNCPPTAEIKSDEVQTLIRQGIERAWRKEAKAYLPQRLNMLAGQHGFSCTRLSVKNTKSRWGSCSAHNNINLSLHLMRLPDHLIDYVILHELTHTVEKNHGPRFWALLDHVSGNARASNAELKQYNIKIY